jgi:hypothetical protein
LHDLYYLYFDAFPKGNSFIEIVLDLPHFRNEIRRFHELWGGPSARENQLGLRGEAFPIFQKLQETFLLEETRGTDFITDHEKADFPAKLLFYPGEPLLGGSVILFREGIRDMPGYPEGPKGYLISETF